MPTLSVSAAAARSLFSSTFSHSKHKFLSSIRMSSSASAIEHIVLFKVKPTADSSQINSMLTSLNSLVSLDPVLHLSAGQLHRVKSSPIPFTHMLHSRYSSKDDLNAYSAHPNHVTVVKSNVVPICDDIMAVDWVADADDIRGHVVPSPGSAIRVTFLKLKEGLGDDDKSKILEVIKGIKGSFGGSVSIKQLTCGENFSPARAKGYSIASIAVFEGLNEMDAVDAKEEIVNLQKDKVRDYLESVIVVDYVMPNPQPANL